MNQKQGKTGDSFQPWRFSCKDIRTRGCISSNGISQECLVVALNVVGIGCLFSCTMSQHVSAISCRWFVHHTSVPVLVTFGHCLFFKNNTGSPAGKIRHMACRRWLGACNCKASALALLASKTRPSELRSCHSLRKSRHADMDMYYVAWVYSLHNIFGCVLFLCFFGRGCPWNTVT